MGAPWQPYLLKPHGTEARARKHLRDGEKPCVPCARAAATANYERRVARGLVSGLTRSEAQQLRRQRERKARLTPKEAGQ